MVPPAYQKTPAGYTPANTWMMHKQREHKRVYFQYLAIVFSKPLPSLLLEVAVIRPWFVEGRIVLSSGWMNSCPADNISSLSNQNFISVIGIFLLVK